MTDAPRKGLVALALLAVYVVWGSTYYAMRVALETLPPFLMAGPRFVLAGLILFAVQRARGVRAPSAKQWASCACVGVLLLTFGNGAVAIAEQSVSSSVAAIVVASMPIWSAVFGRLTGERASGREWIGLLLGFCGVILLNIGGDLGFDARGLVLLIAPIAWAAGSVASRSLAMPEDGAMSTAAQMIVGGIVLLALAGLTGETIAAPPSARSLLAVLYLTVFGSIAAFTAYVWLLRNVRPTLATSYAYVNPIVAVLLGWGLAHERIGVLTLAATAVSLAGVALIARSAKGRLGDDRRKRDG